ncbi:hypothetical protein SFRURICE_014895 [Spodoptera frugiperda]|nr:hypothetical protein SFRURICE_014895 [Spodoptera frugiperda]
MQLIPSRVPLGGMQCTSLCPGAPCESIEFSVRSIQWTTHVQFYGLVIVSTAALLQLENILTLSIPFISGHRKCGPADGEQG